MFTDGNEVLSDANHRHGNLGYNNWWHGRAEGIGSATALDARSVYRISSQQYEIEILAHDGLGWVLAIDGILQGVERDSGIREMQVHVPLLGRDRSQCRVLMLGGGDGALLHEVLRHAFVTSVVLCESEPALLDVGREYLGFAADLCDPRVELRALCPEAALSFSRGHFDPFDVIFMAWPGNYRAIGESVLDGFCQDLAACLAGDGVCVDSDLVVLGKGRTRWYRDAPGAGGSLLSAIRRSNCFGAVEHYCAVSQLCLGGFTVFSLYQRGQHSYAEPRSEFRGRTYNARMHAASFALPGFCAEVVGVTQNCAESAVERIQPNAWWHEHTFGTGITQALDMKRLYSAESPFQTIEVYDHSVYGRVLVLDGTVQLSQSDEFIYHEMAVHVPLLGRRRQDVRVLIIGGGDGGILREALRHPWVTSVVMVEIDPLVVDVSNQWIGVQGDYADPRVTLLFADGIEFMAQAARTGRKFDLIVVDATDSTGPSKTLWSERFYENLSACVADDGVCVDSDILTWAHGKPRLSREPCDVSVFDIARSSRYFTGVECYFTKVPLYPGGYFAFFLYSKDGRSHSAPEQSFHGRHYNPDVHRAAFALPTWLQAVMDDARGPERTDKRNHD